VNRCGWAGLAALAALFPPSASAATADECWRFAKLSLRAESKACFEQLLKSHSPAVRAEGYWGLGNREQALASFDTAVSRDPKNPALHVRLGRLFQEGSNSTEAAAELKKALDLKPDYAPAYLALAEAAADNFERQAVEAATTAINFDPGLHEAQALLARLALEDSDTKKAIDEADKALKTSSESLDALGVRYAIELLARRPGEEWLQRARQVTPRPARVHELAGHFLVLNRRYDEGIIQFRKAVELDPELHSARSQLGVNLMRLGEDKEAKEHLEKVYQAKYHAAQIVNTLKLLDSYSQYQTFRTPRTVVKLHSKEAALLKPYVESELKRAIATFEGKYKLKLDRPVQVEVYPNHDDFAVRTMGLPGLGALGVTFGYAVAMDSPSGRPPGTFHWASTLWHELSHVFVLAATKHIVPRWFTEGMAVHEETAVSPDWGDRLDPTVIRAIKEKKLLPVEQLDRGFIRPSYSGQVVVSYFQAGRICDYIASKWGYDKLLEMMHAFGEGQTTPQVVEGKLGTKPEEFDRQFLAWLDIQVGGTVRAYDDWRKRIRETAKKAQAGNHDAVIAEAGALLPLYPDYVERDNAYEMLAEAYLAKNDSPKAMEYLERYAKVGGRNPASLIKLAGLQEDAGKKKEAIRTLERLMYIYPIGEEVHVNLGNLYLDTGNTEGAVREYTAVIASKPVDPAAAHFRLARALHSANRSKEAMDHVLQSLEVAPGYRDAQKLLLELSR
jgi:tetratricopeptide (TPR) repeat protein